MGIERQAGSLCLLEACHVCSKLLRVQAEHNLELEHQALVWQLQEAYLPTQRHHHIILACISQQHGLCWILKVAGLLPDIHLQLYELALEFRQPVHYQDVVLLRQRHPCDLIYKRPFADGVHRQSPKVHCRPQPAGSEAVLCTCGQEGCSQQAGCCVLEVPT